MFEEPSKECFPEREEKILKLWEENRIFQKSIEQREEEGAPFFSFYDGPPFATGLPHYGHILAGTLKDVVPRYKTMKGFVVPRRFGWDCHGLPVEHEVEKQEGLSGAKEIEEFGIANFNESCRSIVLRYAREWKETVKRMGRWVDFSKTYRTIDPTFMESVWWVFKEIYKKGHVYEGFKVVPYSSKLGTGLSNTEASENYKNVQDPSLVIEFPLDDQENTSLLAWTTTPWTLISNLALGVGPNIDYVKVSSKKHSKNFILAKDLLHKHFTEEDDFEILSSFKGSELASLTYEPMFPYFEDHKKEGAFRVIEGDFVSTTDGTGIVHMAPAFGEDDFHACKKANIALVCPVDGNGKFTEEISEYQGLFVKDADKEIIKRIKGLSRVFSAGTIQHRYPYCWRSDTPLIYKAVRSWYIGVEKIRDRLVELNDQIHWTPDHVKHNRFGNWLKGARDWSFSRTRYWGTPIPIWKSEDGDLIVIGSVEELEQLSGHKVSDLHKHFIDQITIEKDGKIYTRITEVFDCWFESGCMPYAQNHYPFENKDFVESTFPADFIAEGLDQTRGWFYTLTVIAGILFDKPAFKNVIVNGIILAEDGMKMSKRLKNYPEPSTVLNKYGADALRLYLLQGPVVKADDFRFTEKGLELVLRQVMIPWWNAYSFFITYANINKFIPGNDWKGPSLDADKWILSKLQELVKSVDDGMDAYDLSQAVEPFVKFIDQLTNWYIRTNRRRFYEEKMTPEILNAFNTLYTVLLELCKVAAPFVPFITEVMFQNLKKRDMPESVHLCDFASYKSAWRSEMIEDVTEVVQKSVSLGNFLRKQEKIKVRQPLPSLEIICTNESLLGALKNQEGIIAEELNVKAVLFSSVEKNLVKRIVKPNFRVLGKKVGKYMRDVQKIIAAFTKEQVSQIELEGSINIEVGETSFELTSEDIAVERQVEEGIVAANDGEVTVVLNTELNDELITEGIAREIRNKVSTMRRDQGLKVTDRIILNIHSSEKVLSAIEDYREFLQTELLAVSIGFDPSENATEWDINGMMTKIAIEKVGSIS